jgi:hypothetical protein
MIAGSASDDFLFTQFPRMIFSKRSQYINISVLGCLSATTLVVVGDSFFEMFCKHPIYWAYVDAPHRE